MLYHSLRVLHIYIVPIFVITNKFQIITHISCDVNVHSCDKRHLMSMFLISCACVFRVLDNVSLPINRCVLSCNMYLLLPLVAHCGSIDSRVT